MTHTHCINGHRIPWGQPRYLEMRGPHLVREVCLGCIVKKTRERTGSASGDPEAAPAAQIHVRGDCDDCRAGKPHFGSAPPRRLMRVSGEQGFPLEG